MFTQSIRNFLTSLLNLFSLLSQTSNAFISSWESRNHGQSLSLTPVRCIQRPTASLPITNYPGNLKNWYLVIDNLRKIGNGIGIGITNSKTIGITNYQFHQQQKYINSARHCLKRLCIICAPTVCSRQCAAVYIYARCGNVILRTRWNQWLIYSTDIINWQAAITNSTKDDGFQPQKL